MDLVAQRVATRVSDFVIDNTPVDTGKARSNWLVTLQRPANTVREPFAPGERLGLSETANANAAKAAAKRVIDSQRSGQSIIIQNNVPYIRALNDGSSQQAPRNFVEQAVKTGTEAVGEERLEL